MEPDPDAEEQDMSEAWMRGKTLSGVEHALDAASAAPWNDAWGVS